MNGVPKQVLIGIAISNRFTVEAVQDLYKGIEFACKKYNVEMGAAALQFSMKDERVTSTLCGVTSVQSIEKNLSWAETSIPEKFWDEVLKLPYSTKDPESERKYTPG